MGRTVLPLEALRKNLFFASSGFSWWLLEFFGLEMHHSSLCPSPHVCLSSLLLSPMKTCIIGFRAHPRIQDDLTSRSIITSAKTLFPNKEVQGLGVRRWRYILGWGEIGGTTIQPTIGGKKTHIAKKMAARGMEYHWAIEEGGGLCPVIGCRTWLPLLL